MSTAQTDIKAAIRQAVTGCGAVAVGFARAADTDSRAMGQMAEWLRRGGHAGMDYLERHMPLKQNPEHVMEGASTVVCAAFSYAPSATRDDALPMIAGYALGEDYHDVLRRRLREATDSLRDSFGGEWRICIDSAPLPERYWAMKAGIGRLGRNGTLIVDGCGCYVFLAEILTSLEIEPDTPSAEGCMGCGACVRACPTQALCDDGTIDSARCLSYLTIEHKGPWTGRMREAMQTGAGRRCLFGCDICLRVCPHNLDAVPSRIAEFRPSETIMRIDAEDVDGMDRETFARAFKGSPLKRARLEGLMRNALNILGKD